MRRNLNGALLSFLGLALCAGHTNAETTNLFANPGFETIVEQAGTPTPKGFVFGKYSGAEGDFSIDDKIIHSGSRSVRMEKSNDKGWLSVTQVRTLAPSDSPKARKFEMSAWVMAEGAGAGSLVAWCADGKKPQLNWKSISVFKGSFEWKKLSGTIETPPDAKSVTLSVRLNGKGLAWVDDVELAECTVEETPTGNLLSNPDMKGAPETATGLPRGWQKKMVEGLETSCEFKVGQGPKEGQQAIELEWKHGGPRFGAEPELVSNLEPGGTLEFSADARSVGASKAVLAAEALDKNGRLVSEWKSEPLDSREWKRVALLFKAPQETSKVKVYCLNEGQGSVSFANARLASSLEKVAEAFPVQAICLPVEMMKNLYGGDGEFNTFADRPVPLAFEFTGSLKNAKETSLIIDLPKEVRLSDCFNSHGSLQESETPDTKPITRDGMKYVRHTFKNPKVFSILTPSAAWERKLVMALMPEDQSLEGKSWKVYWSMDSDGKKSGENSFTLNILPPLKKTQNPRNFPILMYATCDMNFNAPDVFAKVAEIYEEAGAALRNRGGESKIIPKDAILEKRGWTMWKSFPDYMHYKFIQKGKGWDSIKDKVEFCVKANGKKDGDKLCPQYFVKDRQFEKYIREFLADNLKRCNLKDGEIVSFDVEPWDTMDWCFCDRCRSDFAKYCGLDKTPDTQEIKTKLKSQWRDFRCANTAEVMRIHCEVSKENFPNSKIIDYDYVVRYDKPDHRDFFYSVAKDPKLNEKYFDGHMASYYHFIDKEALEMIDVNAGNLAKEYWTIGALDRAGTYLNAREVLTPAQTRLYILASAVAGAKGAGFYSGKHVDGKFFQAIDQATSEIAKLEEYFVKGKRADSKAATSPLPYFQKKIKTGDKEIEISRPNWKDFFAHRCHELGDEKLISLFNYNPEKKACVKVSVETRRDRTTILDSVTNTRIIPSKNKNHWDAAGTVEGFYCMVPSRDVKFLVVKPFSEDDLKITSVVASDETLAEFEREKGSVSEAPGLAQPQSSGGLSIGYDDLDKDGRAELTLSSPSQKIWLNTECGGVVSEWRVAEKDLCQAGLGVPSTLKSMCWDYFWLPKDLRQNGAESAPTKLEKAEIVDGVARAVVSNRLQKAPLEIIKTYEMNASDIGFKLSYRIKNKGDKPVSFSFWSHNFPKLSKGKLDETMSVFIPTTDGAREITKTSGQFVFVENKDTHPGFTPKDISGVLARGRLGVWSSDERHGVVAEVDKSKIMAAYLWWSAHPTLEWMYKETTLAPDEEWTTEIKYSFVPETNGPDFGRQMSK